MNLIEKLNWRYAVKEMSGEKPDDTKIQTLLEATRLTASSYGFQPYKLVVVKNQQLKDRLKSASFNQEKVSQASHILVFAVRTNLDESLVDEFIQLNSEIRNEPVENFDRLRNNILTKIDRQKKQGTLESWTAKQAYIALGNVLTSAAVLDVDACPMEGFNAEEYNEILGLNKQNLSAAVICAIGVRSENDDYRLKKKIRWHPEDFFVIM